MLYLGIRNKYEDKFDIDDEMGGRLILTPMDYDGEGDTHDNTIEYHQSRHTVDTYNWASPETKALVAEMEVFITSLIIKHDLD